MGCNVTHTYNSTPFFFLSLSLFVHLCFICSANKITQLMTIIKGNKTVNNEATIKSYVILFNSSSYKLTRFPHSKQRTWFGIIRLFLTCMNFYTRRWNDASIRLSICKIKNPGLHLPGLHCTHTYKTKLFELFSLRYGGLFGFMMGSIFF